MDFSLFTEKLNSYIQLNLMANSFAAPCPAENLSIMFQNPLMLNTQAYMDPSTLTSVPQYPNIINSVFLTPNMAPNCTDFTNNIFDFSTKKKTDIMPNYADEFKKNTQPVRDKVNQMVVNSTDLNKYGKQNAEKIKLLQTEMQNKTIQLLEFAKSKGLKVTITSGFRTQAQQEHLLKTRPKYAAKNSLHCLGRAIDIRIEGGNDADYEMLGRYAKSIGMRWGGDFRKVRERWHFDIGRA